MKIIPNWAHSYAPLIELNATVIDVAMERNSPLNILWTQSSSLTFQTHFTHPRNSEIKNLIIFM